MRRGDTRATHHQRRWRSLLLVGPLPLILGAGPCGPITGGRIDGTPATGRVSDWSSCNAESTIQVETKPDEPYSVTTWCITDGANLWVPSRGAADKQWVKNVVADPRVRVRIGETIYSLRAQRVTDTDEMKRIIPLLRAKYRMARWFMDDDPAHSPETWYFRMEQL